MVVVNNPGFLDALKSISRYFKCDSTGVGVVFISIDKPLVRPTKAQFTEAMLDLATLMLIGPRFTPNLVRWYPNYQGDMVILAVDEDVWEQAMARLPLPEVS